MKIRQGFVSNSSTTSFCIYGTEVTDEMKENFLKIYPHDEDIDDDAVGEPDEEDEDYEFDDYDDEKLYEVSEKADLDYHHTPWGTTYIGRAYSGIKDDETGQEFKKNTKKAIKKLFGIAAVECSRISQAYMD